MDNQLPKELIPEHWKNTSLTNISEEIWEDAVFIYKNGDVRNYRGFYQCSNFGRVKSIYNKPLILKQILKNGYPFVNITLNGEYKNTFIHRLLMSTFNSRGVSECVNHKNGIKWDNRVENLEWCTYKENRKHCLDNGLQVPKRGEDHYMNGRNPAIHPKSRKVFQYDLNGNYLNKFEFIRQATEGTGAPCIWDVCAGYKKTSGGFIWKFAD